MTNQAFYNLLDQAGHRLGDLARNNPAYEFELRKLIEIISNKFTDEDDDNLKFVKRVLEGVTITETDSKIARDYIHTIRVKIRELIKNANQ